MISIAVLMCTELFFLNIYLEIIIQEEMQCVLLLIIKMMIIVEVQTNGITTIIIIVREKTETFVNKVTIIYTYINM